MMSVHFNYFKRMELHAWSVGGTLVPPRVRYISFEFPEVR